MCVCVLAGAFHTVLNRMFGHLYSYKLQPYSLHCYLQHLLVAVLISSPTLCSKMKNVFPNIEELCADCPDAEFSPVSESLLCRHKMTQKVHTYQKRLTLLKCLNFPLGQERCIILNNNVVELVVTCIVSLGAGKAWYHLVPRLTNYCFNWLKLSFSQLKHAAMLYCGMYYFFFFFPIFILFGQHSGPVGSWVLVSRLYSLFSL